MTTSLWCDAVIRLCKSTTNFDQGTSQAGHAQRNRALAEIPDGLVYNLDDDNIMHPHFWEIHPQLTPGRLTTFDQQRSIDQVMPGDNPTVLDIDMGSFVVDRDLIGDIKFDHTESVADGLFVEEVLESMYISQELLHSIIFTSNRSSCHSNYIYMAWCIVTHNSSQACYNLSMFDKNTAVSCSNIVSCDVRAHFLLPCICNTAFNDCQVSKSKPLTANFPSQTHSHVDVQI